MSRLLVTGAAGFVGGVVVEIARERGHGVIELDRRRPGSGDAGPAFAEADVCDLAAVTAAAEGCDGIVHCAAVVGPKPATADPVAATHVNVQGMLAVLEAAKRHGIPVVNLSTATLYGHRPGLEPLDEAAPVDPVGIYDATKLMAETLCDAYRKTFRVSVASIRTGFVYGAAHSTGDYFVERILGGQTILEDAGADHPCDFTYVRDLALGLVLAAEVGGLPKPVYNVTGGALRTRAELARAVRRHFPEVRIEQKPGTDPARHLRGPCVIARAARDFGYRPAHSLESGIADWIQRLDGRNAA